MVNALELTTEHHVRPDLRLPIPDVLVDRSSERKLETLHYVVVGFSRLKLTFFLQELHVLLIDILLSPILGYIVKEYVLLGPHLA
jgi:hypothetical protein